MSDHVRASKHSEHILQVASVLFARNGYHATTTREIAQIADVSENTLFRQFESKEQLFWQALRHRFTMLTLRRELLADIANGNSPDLVLPQLLAHLRRIAIANPDTVRLVAVAFLEFRWAAGNPCAEAFAPVFAVLKSYFRKHIEAGNLRELDPSILTSVLGLSVVAYPEIARTLDGNSRYHENHSALESLSQFWLDVLLDHRNETQLKLAESEQGTPLSKEI